MDISVMELLDELIAIPSPFFHERKIAERLEILLKDLGFETSRQTVRRPALVDGKVMEYEHFNVLGEKGKGERSFLLYGHMDTVPAVNAWSDMKLDPFKGVLKDGKLYGLGACDMKGGIAAIVKAVENLDPEGYKIKVCFGVDEENESAGAWVLVNSPFIKDCAGCIVPEVGSGNAAQAPENLVLGRHGRNRIGIRIRGRAAHASAPEFIVNPIEYALEFINEAKKIDLGNDPEMPAGNVSVAAIHAEGGGLSSPEECVIWVDNLFSPPVKSANVFEQYEGICNRLAAKYGASPDAPASPDGYSLPAFTVIDLSKLSDWEKQVFTPRSTPFMEAWKIDPEHPLVKRAAEAILDATGKLAVFACGKSNADENYIGQVVPTVVVPPMGGNEHQGGEYVFPESVENAAKIIAATIPKYMGQ